MWFPLALAVSGQSYFQKHFSKENLRENPLLHEIDILFQPVLVLLMMQNKTAINWVLVRGIRIGRICFVLKAVRIFETFEGGLF